MKRDKRRYELVKYDFSKRETIAVVRTVIGIHKAEALADELTQQLPAEERARGIRIFVK